MSTKTRLSAITLSALIGVSGAIGVSSASASDAVANRVTTEYRQTWCNGTSVNARKGPSTNYSVIKRYKPNKVFTVVDERDGYSAQLDDIVTWYKVDLGGWIRADLLHMC